jgi:4-hydroxy-tetrahydrodipicolinate synthase
MTNAAPLLRGIIVPMVTPLAAADALDVAALERLIEHLLDGEVSGLFLLGTCGEGPSLDYQLRRELITRTCRQVSGRVPVVVGVTDCSAIETDAMAGHAANAGASAVVIAPPFYFPVDRNELAGFVRRRVHKSPLPVVLYNMPALTKMAFEPDNVRRLMDEPNIIGLKDSSGDLDYFELLLSAARERADWSFLVGPEHLLVQSLQLGGHGGVCGGANIFPRLFVRIYEAAAKPSAELERLWDQALALGGIYEFDGGGAVSAVKGLKAALLSLGLGNGRLAEPLMSLPDAAIKQIALIVGALAEQLNHDHLMVNRGARNGAAQRLKSNQPRVFPR